MALSWDFFYFWFWLMIASVGCIIKLKREPPFSVGNWQQIHERIKMVKTLISSQALQPNLRITQMLLQTCLPSDALALFKLVWLVLLAQVRTHYKVGKLNLWTLFCNVCINFLSSQIWKKIMLELNDKPSSVTMFSTDFSFQNLVFWNLFEFSVAEITWKSISLTFWIQILPNKFH
jgi:hypothetical protein